MEGEPFIIITDLFHIVFSRALQNNEVEVLPYDERNYHAHEAEKGVIECIDQFEQWYLAGLFKVHERENNKMDCYKSGFYRIMRAIALRMG